MGYSWSSGSADDPAPSTYQPQHALRPPRKFRLAIPRMFAGLSHDKKYPARTTPGVARGLARGRGRGLDEGAEGNVDGLGSK